MMQPNYLLERVMELILSKGFCVFYLECDSINCCYASAKVRIIKFVFIILKTTYV